MYPEVLAYEVIADGKIYLVKEFRLNIIENTDKLSVKSFTADEFKKNFIILDENYAIYCGRLSDMSFVKTDYGVYLNCPYGIYRAHHSFEIKRFVKQIIDYLLLNSIVLDIQLMRTIRGMINEHKNDKIDYKKSLDEHVFSLYQLGFYSDGDMLLYEIS